MDPSSHKHPEKVPSWSIVLSFYNREQLLPQSIESCLRQTYTDFELVLVDDGSTDNSVAVARRYVKDDPRVRLIEHAHNRGICAGYTTAYDAALGSYILRMCSDDFLEPQAIETFDQVYAAHPEVALVNSNLVWVTFDGEYVGTLDAQDPQNFDPVCNRLGLSFAITKNAWRAVRPFDERCAGAEDFDLLVRILEQFPGRKATGKPLYNVRIEGPRVSSNAGLMDRGLTHMHFKRKCRAFRRSPTNVRLIGSLIKCLCRKTIGEINYASRKFRINSTGSK